MSFSSFLLVLSICRVSCPVFIPVSLREPASTVDTAKDLSDPMPSSSHPPPKIHCRWRIVDTVWGKLQWIAACFWVSLNVFPGILGILSVLFLDKKKVEETVDRSSMELVRLSGPSATASGIDHHHQQRNCGR